MSKFDTGMDQDQHQVVQDHQQQFCPTLMVEHQNPIIFSRVNIGMLMPPSIETFLPHYAQPQPHE
jgi:hypothetical protein